MYKVLRYVHLKGKQDHFKIIASQSLSLAGFPPRPLGREKRCGAAPGERCAAAEGRESDSHGPELHRHTQGVKSKAGMEYSKIPVISVLDGEIIFLKHNSLLIKERTEKIKTKRKKRGKEGRKEKGPKWPASLFAWARSHSSPEDRCAKGTAGVSIKRQTLGSD